MTISGISIVDPVLPSPKSLVIKSSVAVFLHAQLQFREVELLVRITSQLQMILQGELLRLIFFFCFRYSGIRLFLLM